MNNEEENKNASNPNIQNNEGTASKQDEKTAETILPSSMLALVQKNFKTKARNIRIQLLLCASFILIGWLLLFIGLGVFTVQYNYLLQEYTQELNNAISTNSATVPVFHSNDAGTRAGSALTAIGIIVFLVSYVGLIINSIVMYLQKDFKIIQNASDGVKVGFITTNILSFFLPLLGSIGFMVFTVLITKTNSEYFKEQVRKYVIEQEKNEAEAKSSANNLPTTN